MRRTQLYVPGNDSRKIMKASQIGCDSVILDLEDSVPMDQKQIARDTISNEIGKYDWGNKEVCVRINKLGEKYSNEDIILCKKLQRVDTIVLPKAESNLSGINELTGRSLIPIIETARGITNIQEIAGSKGVAAITYGAADLALSLHADVQAYLSSESLKTFIVFHSRANSLEPIDCVYFDLNNKSGFYESCITARKLGFSGKQVIHPSQVEVANSVFKPSKQEIEDARRIVEFYEREIRKGKGAFLLEGKLIDEVHYRLAKKTLSEQG